MIAADGLLMEDWDLMFRAVLERLAATIGARGSISAVIHRSDASASLRFVLLECADALEYLNGAALELRAPSFEEGDQPLRPGSRLATLQWPGQSGPQTLQSALPNFGFAVGAVHDPISIRTSFETAGSEKRRQQEKAVSPKHDHPARVATSACGGPPVPSPEESAELKTELDTCRTAGGPMFSLRCLGERVNEIVKSRFVTTVVVAIVFMIVVSSVSSR